MRFILTLIIFTLLPFASVNAKTWRFAVVPKFHSVFFDQSGDGCKFAAAQLDAVECIYRGPEKGDVRIQDKIIEQLLSEGIDGLAVAVTDSAFLARSSIQKAKQAGVPVITYDSDFDLATQEKYSELNLAYIGTNNFEFGKALGQQLQKLRPNGGQLLIQTGRPDAPNLNLRIMGIRSALSGKSYSTPPGQILNNDHGWTEIRSPIPNYDQINRAIKQLDSTLKADKADSFITVGGWVQNNEQQYRNMIAPFKATLANNKVVVILADASPSQLAMLKDHLAHANIAQNPYEMGKQAIFTLHKIVTQQAYDKLIYTPHATCTPDNYATCNKY